MLAVAVHDVSRNVHGIHAHDDWRVHLDRTLETDLPAEPEILDLHCLTLRKPDEHRFAASLDAAHAVGIIDLEATTDLGHGNVGPGREEASKARSARTL